MLRNPRKLDSYAQNRVGLFNASNNKNHLSEPIVTAPPQSNADLTSSISCNDIMGVWTGQLNTLPQVALQIFDTGGNIFGDARVEFINSDGQYGIIELLRGYCRENNDGSITMNLNINLDTRLSANMKLRLVDQMNLNVESLTAQDDQNNSLSASGTLHKFPVLSETIPEKNRPCL